MSCVRNQLESMATGGGRRVAGRLFCAVVAAFGLCGAAAGQIGGDVTLGGIPDIANYGSVGGVYGYAIGSQTCNIGDQHLLWQNGGTPAVAMNAYRLFDGRLMQIGLGFAKHACCVVNSNSPAICAGMTCQPGPGGHLRVGCLDVYGAFFNGGQGGLGPRSGINPYTGAFTPFAGTSGDAIFKRLQVHGSDMSSASYPGALFFVEGVYVATEDAQWGNWFNNASYRRATINASFQMSLTGPTYATVPAIYAWRDHGGGAGVPDPSVEIVPVDLPAEGRFFVGSRVKDNGDGTWRYDYAVYNLNSYQACGSFSVPVPGNAAISGVGFSSPQYHSGEPTNFNTPWVHQVGEAATGGRSVRWSHVPQGSNSNAIRWGTMYSFWFTADRPPAEKNGSALLGIYRAGPVDSVGVGVPVPAADPCPGDLNDDQVVDVFDLLALLGAWGECETPGPQTCPADLDGSGGVDVFDLLALLGAWGECP
jgi:hypothetical protein